ncbi:hypothetical protein DPMN_080577 [Dreissena polymorpha]|uniref:Uncharacterized protein n=1 Tax=Dreissena polymorpha TaxID=45954 RepID=A0A9D3YSZ2_DREPO|nr:hypothetical protein DPMN_080577 [Dreissena polymorpha]
MNQSWVGDSWSEYESNPLASDSEEEKRMNRAEARANKKLKAKRSKKNPEARATGHTGKPVVATNNATQGVSMKQSLRRPGLCFACGKPGLWKGAAECSAATQTIRKVFLCLRHRYPKDCSSDFVGKR